MAFAYNEAMTGSPNTSGMPWNLHSKMNIPPKDWYVNITTYCSLLYIDTQHFDCYDQKQTILAALLSAFLTRFSD